MDIKLVHEITNVHKFLESRQRLGNCDDTIALKLAQSMVVQINNLSSLDPAAASRITDAVAASAYSEHGRALICSAVDNKLVAAAPSKKRARKSNDDPAGSSQYLHDGFQNYLTESDWTGLRCSKRSLESKTQLLVDRMVRIGLRKPDEVTIAWAVAILVLTHFSQFPLYKSIHAILNDLKDAF